MLMFPLMNINIFIIIQSQLGLVIQMTIQYARQMVFSISIFVIGYALTAIMLMAVMRISMEMGNMMKTMINPLCCFNELSFPIQGLKLSMLKEARSWSTVLLREPTL